MLGTEIKKGCAHTPNFADNTIQNNCINQIYGYIPIDYIKCKIIGLGLDHFKQNMNLTEYESKKENKSKYLFYKKDNIVIKYFVDSGLITLSGSLHKYLNEGLHNHNQFTYKNYLEALERLKNDFEILPENLYIYTLEYGVNIKPPIKTKLILDNILMHRHIESANGLKDTKGHYLPFKHDKYIIKVYDKAKQNRLKEDLLRFEIKETNWSEYRLEYGIKTLADFNKSDKKIFVDKLLKKWEELIFYDPTIKSLDKWHKYSNVKFWRDVSKKQKSKHLKRLNHLIKTQSQNIKGQISNIILENIEGMQNSDLNKKRTCKLTGIDISNQRLDSSLLSHTGLKLLRDNDLKQYNFIKKAFLSTNWMTSPEQKQIKEIAHNIRSKYIYQKSHIDQSQLNLF
jgi:hypothetical protein